VPTWRDQRGAANGPAGRDGRKVQANTGPRLSELEDISEWAAQQLQPRLPGELRGTSSGNTTTTASLSAQPGQYELHLVCAGLPQAELSVSTWRDVEVLAPVQVPCSGSVFKAPVVLPTPHKSRCRTAGTSVCPLRRIGELESALFQRSFEESDGFGSNAMQGCLGCTWEQAIGHR
jgi:hypothetical protein